MWRNRLKQLFHSIWLDIYAMKCRLACWLSCHNWRVVQVDELPLSDIFILKLECADCGMVDVAYDELNAVDYTPPSDEVPS